MVELADRRALVIPVVAAVVQSGPRFLLCQRPVDKRHGGLWEFPGGKVLDGETFEAAARRELTEELGVRLITVHGEIARYQDEGSEFLIHFLKVEIEGEPFAHEHQELGWFTRTQMRELALAPADRDFVHSPQFEGLLTSVSGEQNGQRGGAIYDHRGRPCSS